jgi:hypothetical protein
MSRTIEAIMRHMVPPAARPQSTNVSVRSTKIVVVRRKPERKLRVVFAPPPLSASTTPNHWEGI